MLNKYPIFLALFIAILSLSACSQLTPEEEVKQTIDDMIEAIESGNKDVILKEYANIPPGRDISQLSFSEKKAQKLLTFLKQAQNATPEISEDKTTASIDTELSSRPLVFEKIDGQWKLNN